jgi:Na+/melibiose symporter-like transporter
MRQKGKIAVVVVLSLIIVAFFLSIYFTVDEKIPDNAVVVITLEDKLYHSIHFDHICVANKTAQTTTLKQAEEMGYKPHQHDEDLGYFRGNRRFLFHHLLSKIGLSVNSRWDKNGNWLW